MELFTGLTVLSLEQATVLPYLTYRLAALVALGSIPFVLFIRPPGKM